MTGPESRARWILIVTVGVLAIVAMNVWWVATYRRGYPLTIDESGYLAIALIDHFALQGGGPDSWWHAVQSQAPYAPLVPAVTSLAYVFKAGVLEGFGVLIGFLVLLVYAVYGIGERLAGPRLGALAALVAATLPGTFVFVREYVFALPAAALLACSVYALLRSDGLRSWRWAVACGIAIGLMLLARTMTVAFVPGLFAAGVVAILIRGRYAARPGGLLGRRFLNLGLVAAAGFAVAAPWYLHNLKPVFDYLTNYGYGSQAAYYGPDHSWISWGRWRDVASRITFNDLLVPLAVLVALGLIVVGVVVIRRLVKADDRRAAAIELLGSDAFSVALVVAACYVALTSSRNGGEGFTIPVAVLLPPLAVIALRYLRAAILVPSLVAVALVTGLNVASNSNLWDSLAEARYVSVPGFGSQPWINGTPHAVSAAREQIPGPATRFTDSDRGWREADSKVVATILRLSDEGAHQPVAFASRNKILNTSTVWLAGMLDAHTPIGLAQLTAEPNDSIATYTRRLSSPEFGLPGILITMSSNAGDFPPLVNQHYAETAAKRLSFHKVRKMTLPDGRVLFVWVKS